MLYSNLSDDDKNYLKSYMIFVPDNDTTVEQLVYAYAMFLHNISDTNLVANTLKKRFGRFSKHWNIDKALEAHKAFQKLALAHPPRTDILR